MAIIFKEDGHIYQSIEDEGIDWTYRYTAPNTEEGRQTAIKRALSEARLTVW